MCLLNPQKTAQIEPRTAISRTRPNPPEPDRDEKQKPMTEKSSNPFSFALRFFLNLGNSEPRVHPNPREWDAMTFHDRHDS